MTCLQGSSPPDSMEMVGAEWIGLSSEVQDSESSGKVGRTRSKRSVDVCYYHKSPTSSKL